MLWFFSPKASDSDILKLTSAGLRPLKSSLLYFCCIYHGWCQRDRSLMKRQGGIISNSSNLQPSGPKAYFFL